MSAASIEVAAPTKPASTVVGSPTGEGMARLALCGSLSEAAAQVQSRILLLLADDPRAVIFDLSEVAGELDDDAIGVLSSIGSEVGSWAGSRVALVCPWPALRHRLQQQRTRPSLVVGASLAVVMTELRSLPAVESVRVSLPAAARSPRAARDLVARTLLDWGSGSQIGMATLVAGELVGGAVAHATGDVGLLVSRCDDRIRIAVRARPSEAGGSGASGRALLLIAAVAHSWGVLPAANGERVVWVALPRLAGDDVDRFVDVGPRRPRAVEPPVTSRPLFNALASAGGPSPGSTNRKGP